jgi:signal-transduction protein with cAMP-binding, CBS, and nucleotidyltransferase domain
MAIFAGNSGERIIDSRRVSALKERLNGQFAGSLGSLSSGDAALLYGTFADTLGDELSWEAEFGEKIEEERTRLAQLPATEFAPETSHRIARLAGEHFERRSSVLALHQICNGFRDILIRRAMELVLAALLPGQSPRFALLVSGDVGRQEQSLLPEHVNYYLVYDGELTADREKWTDAAGMLGDLLDRAELTGNPAAAVSGTVPWVGPPDRFVLEAGDTCLTGDERSDFPFLPDLRGVAGDVEMAAALTDTAISIIREHPDFFVRRARRAATLPVATSLFGWYRIERTGQHRGEFDLQQYTLTPLIRNICVLALKRRVRQFSTPERIKGLLAAGGLSVDLAEKLLVAYHEFMVQKVRRQMESFHGGFRGYFLDPEYLSEQEEERFRNSLDAVVTLQKLVYHQLVGQM